MNCSVCGRPLTDPESVSAGMGPICACKVKADVEASEGDHMEFLSIPIENGITLKRTQTGVATNVPWLVKDHSPDGYEWGYAGSGPADLALNILESVLRAMGHKGTKTLCRWGGDKCFTVAYGLHHKFKNAFIVDMPEEGGTIPLGEIKSWIAKNLHQQRSLF